MLKTCGVVLSLFLTAGGLAACGRGGSTSDQAAATAPTVERPGPVRWNAQSEAFEMNGEPLKVAKLWTFEGSSDGFTAVKSKLAPAAGEGLAVTIVDPIIRSPKGLAVSGAQHQLVLIRLTRTGAGKLWDGALAYATTAHPESSSYIAKPISGADPAVGETTTLVYDMSKLAVGGTDWLDSEIDQIRVDLEDKAGGRFVIHQVAIAAKPVAATPAAPEAAPEGAPATPPAPAADTVKP